MRSQYKVLQEKYQILYENIEPDFVEELLTIYLRPTYEEFYDGVYDFIKKHVPARELKTGSTHISDIVYDYAPASNTLVNKLGEVKKVFRGKGVSSVVEAYEATVCFIEQIIKREQEIEQYKASSFNSPTAMKYLNAAHQKLKNIEQEAAAIWKFWSRKRSQPDDVLYSLSIREFFDAIEEYKAVRALQRQNTKTHGIDLANL